MPEFNGKNTLSSKNMFVNRTVYNAYILTLLENVLGPTLETKQIKDFQKDEKMLYGRLDQIVRNPVFPRSEALRQIAGPPTRDGIQALNFVVDAFSQMKNKFDRDMRNGNLDPNSVALGDLQIYKGYINPLAQYDKHVENLKKNFRKYVIEKRLEKRIKNFGSFIPVFMEYVDLVATSIPLTRTMFLLSRFVSPRISGLVIEIYDGDYGDDKIKEELFYSDRNFEYLKNLAYVFGFVIDKHIPWRLVADLNSPRMRDYIKDQIQVENPTASTVLSYYYVKTYPDDLQSLKSLLVACYNEFVRFRPRTNTITVAATVDKNSARTKFDNNCGTSKTIYRTYVSIEDVTRNNPNTLWLETYAHIRNKETGLSYSETTMREIIKRAKDLSNSLDINVALEYIVGKFDNIEHFGGSLFYDVTRLEMAEDPEARESDVEEKVVRSVQNSNFVLY